MGKLVQIVTEVDLEKLITNIARRDVQLLDIIYGVCGHGDEITEVVRNRGTEMYDTLETLRAKIIKREVRVLEVAYRVEEQVYYFDASERRSCTTYLPKQNYTCTPINNIECKISNNESTETETCWAPCP